MASAFFDNLKFYTAQTGEKYKQRDDLLVASLPEGTLGAGVFTRSKCPSAPVDWCKHILKDGAREIRALIVNAGNANAFVGKLGAEGVQRIGHDAAQLLGIHPDSILMASTGVIGVPLNTDRLMVGVRAALASDPVDYQKAGGAILTTDTIPKSIAQAFEIGGQRYEIRAFAKGSGMIAPDMATMLGFVFTDFPLTRPDMLACLRVASDLSFNAITVDSDTSTSDCVMMFAPETELAAQGMDVFQAVLNCVCMDLAKKIVLDGEGATKFVTVSVCGARDDRAAMVIAKSIANSPLVKTAIAGEDANWGRIVMAVGKAGEEADRDRLSIFFGEICVASDGARSPDYDEGVTSKYMTRKDIDIRVELGLGDGQGTVYTCDLTHEYISINADYRS